MQWHLEARVNGLTQQWVRKSAASALLNWQQCTGQQGAETGFGFAPPVVQNQDLGQATALGAVETGAPGLWASPTTGTGMSGFGLAPLATDNQGFGPTSPSGATASKGLGQWANPTTGMGISAYGLAQPATGNQGFSQATASGAMATGTA